MADPSEDTVVAHDGTPRPLSRSERKRRHREAQQQQQQQQQQAAPRTGVEAGDARAEATLKKLKKSRFLPLADEQLGLVSRRCVIEYDGTLFHGFQAQEKGVDTRTVQETIEDAILRTTGEQVRVHGSSRTDKGVHARGHVVHFSSRCQVDNAAFRDALNTRLPEDVVCHSMGSIPVAPSISEQGDPKQASGALEDSVQAVAIGKEYEYTIAYGSVRPVLDRHHVWFIKRELNLDKMRAAIMHFVSSPPAPLDFSAFTPPKSSQLNDDMGKGNFCTLFSIELVDQTPGNHQEEISSRRICLRFRGDRFLYKMVRNLVGTFVDVGLEKISPDAIPTILSSQDRAKAGQGAPPQGLTLVRALYSM